MHSFFQVKFNEASRAVVAEAVAFVAIHFRSALFPLFLFATIAASSFWNAGLARYDFIFIACLSAQLLLVIAKLESLREIYVLGIFHLCGLGLEIYKVNHGSWSYPDSGNWRLGSVPVYSGFMYASVASYMLQAWKHFQLQLENYPNWKWILAISIVIYMNFFLNKFWTESRWFVVLLVVSIFWSTKVTFINIDRRFKLPLNATFFLLGLFVWFAEHICSALGGYQYPYQKDGWTWVDPGKFTAWCLLVVCFAVVASLHRKTIHDNSQ